jgi:hypothetical protein
VIADGAAIPRSGKSLRIEFKVGGEWDAFPDVVTDANGRFSYARKFKAGANVKYKFRAVAPWTDGWVYETGTSEVRAVVLR